MPHPLVASPALQHAQPAPPHPPNSNNPPDPSDTAADAFHLRSLQSQCPDPKPLQPPIAPSNEPQPPVPAHNAVVETTVTVSSAIPDLSFAAGMPKAVLSGEHAKDRTEPTQNGTCTNPLKPVTTLSTVQPGQAASETQEKQPPVLVTRPKPDEKDPAGDTVVPNATLNETSEQTSSLSNDTSPSKESAALSPCPQAESETIMEQKEESFVADLKVGTSVEVIDKKRYVHLPIFVVISQRESGVCQILHDANVFRFHSCSNGPLIMDCGSFRGNFVGFRREKRCLQESEPPVNVIQQDSDTGSVGSDLKRRKTGPEGERVVSLCSKPESVKEEKADEVPQPEKEKESSKGDRDDASEPKPILRTVVAPVGGMLRMLRSSPVAMEAEAPVGKNRSAGSVTSQTSVIVAPTPNNALSNGDRAGNLEKGTGAVLDVENRMDIEPKKRKSVSWAPKENLVDVQYIDTRLELVRSWDPESEITLPFAPATLQMFKSMTEEQRKAERNGDNRPTGMDTAANWNQDQDRKRSAFEAARKKEHDMEQERARRVREELQQILNKMSPIRSWRRPSAIVLPAECRMDAEGPKRFDLGDEEYQPSRGNSDVQSPPSPPPADIESSVDAMRASDSNVRLFPLSDGSVEAAEGDSSGGFGNSLRGDRRIVNDVTEANYRAQDNHRAFAGFGNGTRLDTRNDNDSVSPFSVSNNESHSVGGSLAFNSGISGFHNENGHSLPPHAVQHLLSALQSSGLLNQPNNGSHDRSGSGDYASGGTLKGNERDEGGDAYRDRRGLSNLNEDGSNQASGNNDVEYMEDDRRQMHVPENSSMGAGPGIGMPNSGIGPPPPPRPMLSHPGQLPPGFQQGVQPGMIEGFPFPMPPMPPPPMGMHPNMLPLGMGIPMPPMGMPLPFGMPPGPMPMNGPNQGMSGSKSGKSCSGRGRDVETITRPKSKGSKQRKKCKYFGTKQGCRDGSSCVFAHN